MALNLYLDDCANSDLLADFLRQAGHTVVRPTEVGTTGVRDPAHLAYAVTHDLVLLTKNPKDFLILHLQDQNHPGIFGVYQDNDPTRDMGLGDIVTAIGKIEAASACGYPIAGMFHDLNAWR